MIILNQVEVELGLLKYQKRTLAQMIISKTNIVDTCDNQRIDIDYNNEKHYMFIDYKSYEKLDNFSLPFVCGIHGPLLETG